MCKNLKDLSNGFRQLKWIDAKFFIWGNTCRLGLIVFHIRNLNNIF